MPPSPSGSGVGSSVRPGRGRDARRRQPDHVPGSWRQRRGPARCGRRRSSATTACPPNHRRRSPAVSPRGRTARAARYGGQRRVRRTAARTARRRGGRPVSAATQAEIDERRLVARTRRTTPSDPSPDQLGGNRVPGEEVMARPGGDPGHRSIPGHRGPGPTHAPKQTGRFLGSCPWACAPVCGQRPSPDASSRGRRAMQRADRHTPLPGAAQFGAPPVQPLCGRLAVVCFRRPSRQSGPLCQPRQFQAVRRPTKPDLEVGGEVGDLRSDRRRREEPRWPVDSVVDGQS